MHFFLKNSIFFISKTFIKSINSSVRDKIINNKFLVKMVCMLIIEYYDDPERGIINKNTTKEELRKYLKSSYLYDEKRVFYDIPCPQGDYFHYLGIGTINNDSNYIDAFTVNSTPIYLYYKGFNLYTDYNKIMKEFKKRKIPFQYAFEGHAILLENEKIRICISDLDNWEEDGKITYSDNGEVQSVGFEMQKLNGSISFERLSSHHIPSKVTYENSNISSDDGPAIRMSYDHEKYFASHGKSRKTLRFLEQQKQLVQGGKIMKAIQVDEEDIRFKTSSTYASALKEMKDYARKLDPNDFISKK